MPCRDDYIEPHREPDLLIPLLCEACKKLAPGGMASCSPELNAWWEEHQKRDAARIAREAKEKATKESEQRKKDQKELERLAKKLGKKVS